MGRGLLRCGHSECALLLYSEDVAQDEECRDDVEGDGDLAPLAAKELDQRVGDEPEAIPSAIL